MFEAKMMKIRCERRQEGQGNNRVLPNGAAVVIIATGKHRREPVKVDGLDGWEGCAIRTAAT
jgi:hypothetical protein